ncbi:MAG: VCBS repeat-containing protein [Saprospiraceae bacterium]|nr:VCBS repeat-containing protein [Saprospiraceae bacterium]
MLSTSRKSAIFFLPSIMALWLASCQVKDSSTFQKNHLFNEIHEQKTGITFKNELKETKEANIVLYPYYYNGGGVAIGDLDNDDLPDIFFTGNMVGDRLYKNLGNLSFDDVTTKCGILSSNLWTTGVTMVDINNDGWLDIYVCRSGMGSYRHNLLYVNLQNGKFQEQAKAFGLNDNGYSVQSYFFDFDLDGDLDMYLVNHSKRFFENQEALFTIDNPSDEERDKLYLNQGNGHFEDVSKAAGIDHFAFGLSAAIADFNGDGYPDIYAASDFFEPDFLYVNQQNGTFVNRLKDLMPHTSFSSMGSDAADFNNDGWVDLMVCDMQSADNYRKKALMASMDVERFRKMVDGGYHYQYMQNTLQLNRGVAFFSEIAEYSGVAETDWSWGPLFADFDNDGWKDLFVSNGIRRDIQYKDLRYDLQQKNIDPRDNPMHIVNNLPSQKMMNFLFRNSGSYLFENVTSNWGLDHEGFSTGAAYADLDGDGDLEVVLNNIDDQARIYENSAQEYAHFLQIKLRGTIDNIFGIGAKARISCGQLQQFQHIQTSRGFQSSVAPMLHFGLGSSSVVDSVVVTWPNGSIQVLTDVSADQTIEIVQQTSVANRQPNRQPHKPFFKRYTSLNWQHQENSFNDFEKEVLLPHRYSRLGPYLTVGDVNADGFDDLYIGGAQNQSGALFLQTKDGAFVQRHNPWSADAKYEDMGAAFFDFDLDGDLDLYVASGGNDQDNITMLEDRMYLNDGNGNFKRDQSVLPKRFLSSSIVRPDDIDGDGDIDLFIGGRQTPGKYPFPVSSQILINNGHTYEDITSQIAPDLIEIGMVTDAQWTDFDGDSDQDLMLVGEWMPITILENVEGKWHRQVNASLDSTHGWWYSLAQADMDSDGDLDYVMGNLGTNYKYKASLTEPFQVFAHDFDDNGSIDIVLGYFDNGELFPLRGRQCSAEQMPIIKKEFPSYTAFASASLTEIYSEIDLKNSLHHKAYTFNSIYLENVGGGDFLHHSLPAEAQFSAVNGILIKDIDHDNNLDLILGGNMYGSEVETVRNDASLGLVLLGDGNGSFTSLSPAASGFMIPKDVKSLVRVQVGDNYTVVVGCNNDSIQSFMLNSTNNKNPF